MSKHPSRNKKRSQLQSTDSANNSFVKSVTSKVSGLLPATIAKWFNFSDSANSNGSAPLADATDSSTEDEGMENSVLPRPPPAKRVRSSSGNYNYYSRLETDTTVESTEQCIPYNTLQTAPKNSTVTRDTNFVSTPLTSSVEQSRMERGESDMFRSPYAISGSGHSVVMKRKSLFDNSDATVATVSKAHESRLESDSKRSSFQATLLGSPFYPGRTTYGGATSQYINQPNITQKMHAHVNQSTDSDSATMSYSSRRVMDLLEDYSSPLKEAHRIPTFTWNSKNKLIVEYSENPNPPNNKTLSYKTRELHVPSVASILRLRKRSRLMDTTNAARQILASHSSASSYPYCRQKLFETQRDQNDVDNSKKHTTKIKSRLYNSQLQSRRVRDEVDSTVVPPLDLPKVFLQIDHNNLPKFTFGGTTASKPNFTSTPKSSISSSTSALSCPVTHTITKATENTISKSETTSVSSGFKFSNPVKISLDVPQSISTIPKFIFVSPERPIDKLTIDKKESTISPIPAGASPPKEKAKAEMTKSKDWQCPDCWVFNKTYVEKCVCCGFKKMKVVEDKQDIHSVCKTVDSEANKDKCKNSEKISSDNFDTQPSLKVNNQNKNKCPDCWVFNDPSAEKCVCCGASISKKPADQVLAESSSVTSSDWTCDDCWIKNKSSVDKCAACGGAKPGAKQSSTPALASGALTTTVFKQPDPLFSNVMKSQSGMWECSSCLVKNYNDKDKCVCCEFERPGSVKEPVKKTYNFGMNTNVMFKFGIDSNAQVVNIPKQGDKDKEESETNNNVLSKAPAFTFGMSTKKLEDGNSNIKETTEEKLCETPKFSFGLPSATATGAPLVFDNVNKMPYVAPDKAEEKEKLQEVPKVEFKIPARPPQKRSKSIFRSSLKSNKTPDKPLTIPVLVPSAVPEEKNEDPSTTKTVLQQSVISSEGTQPQNKFSFTETSEPTVQNVFAQPASTTATITTSFTSPPQISSEISAATVFQKPSQTCTTTSTTQTLFQKSDQQTNSAISLFQKPEPVSTAAPQILATTAPLFSFGANSEPSTTQSEKPKYNFNFGSANNMNEGSSFKFKLPAFGASTENASSTKFTISSGTSIGTNKPLTNNPLVGNGLSTGNSLGSTLAGNNGLPTGNLAANSKATTSSLSTGNELQGSDALPATASSIFGAAVQKENIWSAANNSTSNLFSSNTASNGNSLQKPAAFTFGSSSPFNANNNVTPAFGSSTSPPQNVFSMPAQSPSNPQSLFSTSVKPAQNIFGSAQASSNPAPAMGMFGTPNVGAAPTFGTPSPSIPSFEAPSLTPAPAPTFNFGSPQTTGIFGFGQQQQSTQQPALQTGMYNFGAAAGGAPQVQFNMGSSPSAGVRRVRKAVRRNPQR
ncbi:nuclear pore complex protein Nup153 [Galleria mellonella]|uniref:Nuclear pore complex protein Nup153 n=1 Tax=Galleria mellonella TaxID=7137 RepID=A0A6J1WV61_GALME|nr:nuclear pore complex protein Nup153 [Galleria mellonella]